MNNPAINLTALNWPYFLTFMPTEIETILDRCDYDVIALFFGNRGGKTSQIARQYVKRLLGIHPIPRKNELASKVRCMSSSLPTTSRFEETDNAQYIELKKTIPPELILSDVNTRNQTLVVKRPPGLSSESQFLNSAVQSKNYRIWVRLSWIPYGMMKKHLNLSGKNARCGCWAEETKFLH